MAISRLQHPHICTLHDLGSQAGIDYLVLEYLEGETLEARLKEMRLSLEDVVRIGREVSGAIDAAHQSGVVHRDLKPANVMLTGSGAKVLDFGLSRIPVGSEQADSQMVTWDSSATAEGQIVGTVPYLSPEQLQGRESDRQSDIWALGCLLYEMAFGERPFKGASQADLIAAILRSDPPLSTRASHHVPSALEQIVIKCLEKDPVHRWRTAREVGVALEAVLGGDTAKEITGTDSSDPALDLQRLAVLPFANYSGDSELDGVGFCVAEEILNRLAGVHPTVSRSSSFAFQGPDVRAQALRLGARFLLEGSVRIAGNRLLINAQLVDCSRDDHLWAQSFVSGPSGDVEELRETAASIVGSIQQLFWTHTWEPGSAEWYVKRRTRQDNARALELFQVAAERAPGRSDFLVWQLVCLKQQLVEVWADAPVATVGTMVDLANKLLQQDSGYWNSHCGAGLAHSVSGDRDSWLRCWERAAQLSGSLPLTVGSLSHAKGLLGRFEEAEEGLVRSMTASPDDYLYPRWATALAETRIAWGRYDEAVEAADEAIERNANDFYGSITTAFQAKAVAFAHKGRIADARGMLVQATTLRPGLKASWVNVVFASALPEIRAHYLDGLLAAGIENDL